MFYIDSSQLKAARPLHREDSMLKFFFEHDQSFSEMNEKKNASFSEKLFQAEENEKETSSQYSQHSHEVYGDHDPSSHTLRTVDDILQEYRASKRKQRRDEDNKEDSHTPSINDGVENDDDEETRRSLSKCTGEQLEDEGREFIANENCSIFSKEFDSNSGGSPVPVTRKLLRKQHQPKMQQNREDQVHVNPSTIRHHYKPQRGLLPNSLSRNHHNHDFRFLRQSQNHMGTTNCGRDNESTTQPHLSKAYSDDYDSNTIPNLLNNPIPSESVKICSEDDGMAYLESAATALCNSMKTQLFVSTRPFSFVAVNNMIF